MHSFRFVSFHCAFSYQMEFELTPRLRSALQAASSLEGGGLRAPAGESEGLSSLQRYSRADATTILLSDVQQLSSLLRSARSEDRESGEDPQPVWVHELLEGAAPVLPQVRKRADPHPELRPRLEHLREVQESRAYAAMVGDISRGEDATARDAAEMSTYRSQVRHSSSAFSLSAQLSLRCR